MVVYSPKMEIYQVLTHPHMSVSENKVNTIRRTILPLEFGIPLFFRQSHSSPPSISKQD